MTDDDDAWRWWVTIDDWRLIYDNDGDDAQCEGSFTLGRQKAPASKTSQYGVEARFLALFPRHWEQLRLPPSLGYVCMYTYA